MPELITLEGIPELKAALTRKAREIRASSEAAVAAEAELVKEDARKHAHRRSGQLQDGIEVELEGAHATIGSKSHHGAANEFGTTKMGANPFMTPAADAARTRFPEGAAKVIKEAIG